MEDNIEVKDVQKTEYLDKNGLDMLWTKVKENTHNQVEVERNRAVAKENSISDKVDNLKYVPYTKLELSRYNIPDGISTGYITSKGDDNDSFDVYPNAELTSGTLYGGVTIHSESDEYHSTKEIKVDYDDMRIKFTDGTPSNVYAIYGEKGVDLKINNSSQSLLTADQSVKVIGTDIAPLENGKVPEEYLDLSQYAKKTDISEFDTSDFVSKSDTITQTINSGLIAMDKLQVFSKGYYDQHASLRGGIFIEGADTILTLKDTTASHNYVNLTASKLTMGQQVGDNTLLITTSGIANTDNNANHVYATDGSIADLTQYAKKSEISAGGNVNDVQVNGVSVVENKIANINPATKEKLGVVKVGDGLNVTDGTISVDTTAISGGNYIPYNKTDNDYYTIDKSLKISSENCDTTYDNGHIGFTYHNNNDSFNLACYQIDGRSGNGSYNINTNDGIRIKNRAYEIAISGFNGLEMYATDSDGLIAKTTQINKNSIEFTDVQNGDYIFRIDTTGIHYNGRKENEIPTANGGFVNINNYALKSELPTVPAKVSQLQNDSEFIVKSVYDEKIAALEARIAALEAKHAEAD